MSIPPGGPDKLGIGGGGGTGPPVGGAGAGGPADIPIIGGAGGGCGGWGTAPFELPTGIINYKSLNLRHFRN